MGDNLLKKYGQPLVYKIIQPLINLLVRWKVNPNTITTLGLLINCLAAGIFIYGAEKGLRNEHNYIAWGGVVILLAGLFDMIDGRLARESNHTTHFGALYDSVLDRYSELIMFLGICWYLVAHNYFLSSLFAFIAMIGSIMVSYIRARAESLGAKADVGMMQRPERVIIIGLAAIACGIFSNTVGNDIRIVKPWWPIPVFETISVFTLPIVALAFLTNLTAIRRLLYSKKELENS